MSNVIAPGSSADVNVRVTALTTNPNVPAQYKTIILKKNLVSGVNTLTQAMMSNENTKYVIKYDYVLGSDITVPANCLLDFDGGSLSGGYTISGNNTGINAELVKIINTDVTLAGTWNVAEAYPEWFGAKGDGTTDDTNAIQNAIIVSDTVLFDNKTYMIDATQNGIKPKDGSRLILSEGTILKAIPNNAEFYSVIYINGKNNICIYGGSIYGDKDAHTGSTGAGGHCINIRNSKHIIVDNVKTCYAWGDGIFVGSDENTQLYPDDIKILNCESSNNRRQGMSLTTGNNILVDKCYIHDIEGAEPGHCIDIEPNYANEPIENMKISNCTFEGTMDVHLRSSKSKNDITIADCTGGGYTITTLEKSDSNEDTTVIFKNCIAHTKDNSFRIRNNSTKSKVYLIDCVTYGDVLSTYTTFNSGVWFEYANHNVDIINHRLIGNFNRPYDNRTGTDAGSTDNTVNIDFKIANATFANLPFPVGSGSCYIKANHLNPIVLSSEPSIAVEEATYIVRETSANINFNLYRMPSYGNFTVLNNSEHGITIRKSPSTSAPITIYGKDGNSVAYIYLNTGDSATFRMDPLNNRVYEL